MEIERRETAVPTVLLVGADPAEAWVRDALPAAADLEVTPERDGARQQAAEADVDCAIVAPVEGEDLETVADLRGAHETLPIVYAPAEPDGEAAAAATGAGATDYLPRSTAGSDALADRIERAVERFDRRRQADREQSMFRELLGTLPLSVYFKDREARHVALTAHTTSTFDMEFLGKTDLELYADEIGEELAREAYEDDLRVIETGDRVVRREERHVTPEGEEIWLETTKVPWRDDEGEIVGLIGMTRDVTDAKQRERELEEETRRLEQFASFASHDLRNPVSIATGYLEEAIDGEDPSHELEAVAEALERMDDLIDDLLNMARPETDREIEGWGALDEIARRAWAVAATDSASLTVDCPEGTEIKADEGALRQLFENLFSNAIDHAGPDVAVEVGLTETGFYVEDDGPGIDPEDREQVFDYGYSTGGTGVGLAITEEIADAHGWDPRVEESDAGGARFVFDGVVRRPPPVAEVEPAEPITFDRRTDVDGARPAGEATRTDDGTWTLRGGGSNLWGDVEEYFAVHGPASGDLRVEARVTDLDGVHEYSKAGVVLTEAAEAGAVLGFAGITDAHGAETAWRPTPGDLIDTQQFDAVEGVPAYVRLDRLDERVTAWVSTDGQRWEVLDQAVLAQPDDVRVGLAVSSHAAERRCAATFEDVRVVGIEPRE